MRRCSRSFQTGSSRTSECIRSIPSWSLITLWDPYPSSKYMLVHCGTHTHQSYVCSCITFIVLCSLRYRPKMSQSSNFWHTMKHMPKFNPMLTIVDKHCGSIVTPLHMLWRVVCPLSQIFLAVEIIWGRRLSRGSAALLILTRRGTLMLMGGRCKRECKMNMCFF